MKSTSNKGILVILALAALPYQLHAQTWSNTGTVPGGGRNAWTCATDKSSQQIYLFGAYNGSYLDQAYVYNGTTFNQLTGYPGGLGSTFGYAFFLNNKAYYGGGVDGGYVFFNNTFEYDPSTGFASPWVSKDPIPTPASPFGRAYCFYFEIDNKGYVGEGFGGTNGSNMFTANDFLRFDPTAASGSQWSTMQPYPGLGEYSHAAASLNGKGYAGLGATSIYTPVNQNDFYQYDPVLNQWNQMASFPGQGREGAALIPLEDCNKLVLIGGFNRNNIFYDEVWIFDPNAGVNGQWQQLPGFPGAERAWGAWGGFNNEVYFGLGWNNNFSQLQDDWWKATFNPPVASFTASDTSLCAGDIVSFTDASTGNVTSWNWNFSGGTAPSSTNQNPVVQYNSNGSYDVTLIVTNVCSSDTLTKIGYIDVNPGTDSILPVSPMCSNTAAFTLTTTSLNGTWWGTGITNAATGLFDPNMAGPGTHTVYHTSCSDTAQIQIQIGAVQDATITTPPTSLCLGNVTLDLNSLNAGGTWSGAGITDAINGIITLANAGTGTFTYQYTLGGFCPDSSTVAITITSNADMTITTPASLCVNNTPSTLVSATPGGTWSGNGIINPATGVFDPQTSGTGAQNITYTIAGVCGGTANASVQVNAQPVINPAATVNTGCAPLTVGFTSGATGAFNASWSFGNGMIENSPGNVNTTYAQPGCYDVNLTVTDANGCTTQTVLTSFVCVNPTPVAEFTASTWETTTMNPVIDFTNLSVDASAYNWWVDGTPATSAVHMQHDFGTTAGQYQVCLQAQHASGCADTVCHMITIKDIFTFYLPNAFTPNGDGINDVFMVKGNDIDPNNFELFIFNRWGQQIFHTTDMQEGWDGMSQQLKTTDEVFVWKIKAASLQNGEVVEKTGHITLLR